MNWRKRSGSRFHQGNFANASPRCPRVKKSYASRVSWVNRRWKSSLEKSRVYAWIQSAGLPEAVGVDAMLRRSARV